MMPMAGFMLMFNMHMGEVIFGGIGSGLYTMLIFIFVSVFLAGLMIGRTPDYLGKKIVSFDVKCCSLLLLMIVLDTVDLHGLVVRDRLGHEEQQQQRAARLQRVVLRLQFRDRQQRHRLRRRGLLAHRFHGPRPGQGPVRGRTKTVTVYSSTMFNWTQAFCMLIGRYFEIIPVMALAGALAKKKAVPMHTGSFPVVGPTFCLLVAR